MNVFASNLAIEFNAEQFLCFSAHEEGLLLLSMKGEDPYLSFCYKDPYSNLCSIWKVDLTDEAMLMHMEDDVGIFDPTGLSTFAAYFCDAVLSGITVQRAQGCYPVALDSKVLILRLVYTIGTMRLEGLLRLRLIQQDLDIAVMDMMKFAAKTSLADQVTPAMRAMKPTNVPSTLQIRKEGLDANAGAEDADGSGDGANRSGSPVAVKAKKRKTVGIGMIMKKK